MDETKEALSVQEPHVVLHVKAVLEHSADFFLSYQELQKARRELEEQFPGLNGGGD